jgi:hypothetical protein
VQRAKRCSSRRAFRADRASIASRRHLSRAVESSRLVPDRGRLSPHRTKAPPAGRPQHVVAMEDVRLEPLEQTRDSRDRLAGNCEASLLGGVRNPDAFGARPQRAHPRRIAGSSTPASPVRRPWRLSLRRWRFGHCTQQRTCRFRGAQHANRKHASLPGKIAYRDVSTDRLNTSSRER